MFTHNRERYLKAIEAQTLSIFFAGEAPHKSADQYYPFKVNNNFYYLSGIDQAKAILLIAKGESMAKSYLFIEEQDPQEALWVGEVLTKEQASEASGIPLENIQYLGQFEKMVSNFLQSSRHAIFGVIKGVYFDLERRGIHAPALYANQYANAFQEKYPHLTVYTNQHLIASLRTVKSQEEVNRIKHALAITQKGLETVMKQLKPRLKENQAEAYYNFVLNNNNVKPSFNTIAAGGKNATILHYESNNQQLNDNDLILFDLGVNYKEYCSDISRTYPVNGKFTERQKTIYSIVLEANKRAIAALKPGLTIKEFNDIGKMALIEGAKRIGLIQEDEEITKYYYHSLGHYLGLDVHDVGDYTKPIESGAVITVEPGLYIAEEGIGIRIEDDILVTDDGCINLSEDIIKEIEDIEAFMA